MNKLLHILPPGFIPFLIVAFFYTLYYIFIHKKAKDFYGYIIRLAVIYYFLALYVVISPSRKVGKLNSLFDYPMRRYLNYIPFKSIIELLQGQLAVQLIGNLVLLMPIPIFIYLLFKIESFKISIFTTLIISFIIESYQFIYNVITKTPNSFTDIDDVILNTLGAIISFSLLTIFLKFKLRKQSTNVV